MLLQYFGMTEQQFAPAFVRPFQEKHFEDF